jgi:hypothetical protein
MRAYDPARGRERESREHRARERERERERESACLLRGRIRKWRRRMKGREAPAHLVERVQQHTVVVQEILLREAAHLLDAQAASDVGDVEHARLAGLRRRRARRRVLRCTR